MIAPWHIATQYPTSSYLPMNLSYALSALTLAAAVLAPMQAEACTNLIAGKNMGMKTKRATV